MRRSSDTMWSLRAANSSTHSRSVSFGPRSAGGKAIGGSVSLSDYLLSEAQVAIVPGAAFGSDAHLRFSFALSRERIGTGIERVAAALAKLG